MYIDFSRGAEAKQAKKDWRLSASLFGGHI
jgi:hypothetical protein